MSGQQLQKMPEKSAERSKSSTAEQLLAQAQSGRTIIQYFCPLAESLEWELGQEYLRDRGNKAFIFDEGVLGIGAEYYYHVAKTAAETILNNQV